MQLGLLTLVVLPVAAVLGVGVFAGLHVARSLRRGETPPNASLIGLVIALVAIDGVASLAILLNAALSHSNAAKEAARWTCGGLFVVLVLLPIAALLVVWRRRSRRLREAASEER